MLVAILIISIVNSIMLILALVWIELMSKEINGIKNDMVTYSDVTHIIKDNFKR